MEVELTRIDYNSVSPILSNCVKLLPPQNGPGQQQRLAIGDQDGLLQILSTKRENGATSLETAFRVEMPSKIQSIQLGGVANSVPDKVFVSLENRVCGFNRKGKLFLSFDTNLTESIKLMFVSGPDLMVCGNHVYNHYRDCKDIGSYLCGDLIVDMVALCPNNTTRIITVLACSGRVLRVLEHSRVRQTVELESVPTVLHIPKGTLGDRILCGFSDGRVILFKIDPYSTNVIQDVVVDDRNKSSAITCLDTLDMVGDGKPELILGRRDGTVQVFTMRADNDFEGIEPQQLFCNSYNESITAVQAGCFGTNGFMEIVVCTYSGKVFGLTTQSTATVIVNRANEADAMPVAESIKSPEMESFNRFHEVMPNHLTRSMFEINESMVLSKADATYDLSVEIGVPIELVVFESDVPVELMPADNDNAVLSLEKPNIVEGQHLLATFTFAKGGSHKRLDVRLRTIEGQHGHMEVFVRPQTLKGDSVESKKFPIKPLSLHVRIHKLDPSLPLNIFTLKGGFSFAEMHNWIHLSLPEVPEKLPPTDACEFYFENVILGTVLKCEYQKGQAKFYSDNVTTIAILMDVLTKEMTKKRIKIEMNSELNKSSISHIIKKLEPNLVEHMTLIKSHEILECLLDLDITEEESYCLCDDYRELLLSKDKILLDYQQDKVYTNRIFGLLTDLYVDWFKLRGLDVKSKIPTLINLLEKYEFKDLMAFFDIEEEKW